MKVLWFMCVLVAASTAQNLEDLVATTVDNLWNNIDKAMPGYVNQDNLIAFFCRYDADSTEACLPVTMTTPPPTTTTTTTRAPTTTTTTTQAPTTTTSTTQEPTTTTQTPETSRTANVTVSTTRTAIITASTIPGQAEEKGNPLFFVDEDEFTKGWIQDFPSTSDEVSRALFKMFDVSRFESKEIPEGISYLDVADYMYYFDALIEDGFLDEFEFKVGFNALLRPLLWGTMFIRYRRVAAVPSNYDDAIYNPGWQDLFDNIDINSDNDCTSMEFENYIVGNNFGYSSTALSWFAVTDYFEDGLVDRDFDWFILFQRLNFEEPENAINFEDFIYLDNMVRPDWTPADTPWIKRV